MSSLPSGEHVCGVSGVLCTVTAAIVVAAYGHPMFGDAHGMHRVWHTLEVRYGGLLK